jgi:transposase
MSMTRQNFQEDRQRSRRYWQAHISAQRKSGLSRAAYCKEHNLSYHAATYWNRKLSLPEQEQTNLVPVKFFSNIEINPAQTGRSGLKVILPNKIAIEVGDDFSAATLRKLLAALERN